MLGEFLRANRSCVGLGCSAAHFRLAVVGFCSIRSWLAEYLRRVAALMMQFPPRLVAAEPRVEGVWPPICRPIG